MSQWITVCKLDEILPATGVCGLVDGKHVAVFRPYDDEMVYAISNIDPFAQASVLSRGLIVEHNNELWVASPLKKQRFRLKDGYCLEDENYSVSSFESQVKNGQVQIKISSK